MNARLLVATGNRGKLAELARLFSGLPIELLSPDEVTSVPEVIEDGDTFEANARRKAGVVAEVTGMMVLADDSGLEVDALGGAPGVRSARYAGDGASDADNNAKLLGALDGVADDARTARFRCVLAVADPGGPLGQRIHIEHGLCEGCILRAPRGDRGFGYDPLFLPSGSDRSMAQLTPSEKDARSHRAAAAMRMRAFLEAYLPTR